MPVGLCETSWRVVAAISSERDVVGDEPGEVDFRHPLVGDIDVAAEHRDGGALVRDDADQPCTDHDIPGRLAAKALLRLRFRRCGKTGGGGDCERGESCPGLRCDFHLSFSLRRHRTPRCTNGVHLTFAQYPYF